MGMTPYEQFMMAEKTSRHRAGGTAITAVVLGSVATALSVGAWIVAPIYANARAKAAQDIASAQNAGTAALLNQTAALLATERAERVQGDINLTNTVTDPQSGSQQGSIAAQIENSAVAQATAQVMTGLMTGQYSQNPQSVQLYSAPKPCGCPCGD